MSADVRQFEAKLLCDQEAWKQIQKPQRPLKHKHTLELQSAGALERVQRECKLKTMAQALALVGAELRHRTRETG